MLSLTCSNRGYILLQFMLLLPCPILTYPSLRESASIEINYLNDIIQNVLKERPADTFLLLRRRQDLDCILKEFQPQHPIPTLRLDESTIINVKTLFNSEAISLVCLSELADLKLLTALARDLHRMRETRIIIWLQSVESNLKPFLDIITNQASNYNFVSLIVLHSNPSDVKGSIVAYQLQPFPRPSVVRIRDLHHGTIFPNFWRNFRNKTAIVIANQYPPSSFTSIDRKTGKYMLSGFMDKLVIEFAKKRNIHLQLHGPLGTMKSFDTDEIVKMTLNGEIDLSMHCGFWSPIVECTLFVGFSDLFIVVPCVEEMGISNVYRRLSGCFQIVVWVYLVFSVAETLLLAATCRIFGRRFRFSYTNLFINLNALKGVLGLPIAVRRNRRSTSLYQLILLMSIFSVIITSFINAHLSTLLIKRPTDNDITNFDELRESGIPVIFGTIFRKYIEDDMRSNRFNLHKHQIVFLEAEQRIQMIFAHNSSVGFQMFSKIWNYFNKYQILYNRKTLCRHQGLNILDSYSFHSNLNHNSVYKEAFNEFISLSHAFGYNRHWTEESMRTLFAFSTPGNVTHGPTPLSFDGLEWVWKLIGLCYVASLLVFIGETSVDYWQRRRAPRFAFVV